MALEEYSGRSLRMILSRQNPWWTKESGAVTRVGIPAYVRKDLACVIDSLGDHRIHAVVGPRQIGKTTMLKQLVAKLTGEGCDPRRIMYISLDEPPFTSGLEHIWRALEWYVEEVVHERLDSISGRLYIILDEVQEVDGWQSVLKRWVDLGYNVKFLVSGSSSMGMLSGASESLVGRMQYQEVMPLSFSEYASLGGLDHAAQAGANMRDALVAALAGGDAGPFHEAVESAGNSLAPYADGFRVRLSEYLVYGGRPGIAAVNDLNTKQAMLKDHLQLTIYKDIVKIGNIKSPFPIDSLLSMLAWKSPQIINISRLARDLDVNRNTVKHYLHLLRASYIVQDAQLYSENPGVRARAEKKAYISDPGTRTAAMLSSAAYVLDDPSDMGRAAESAVCDHTLRLARSYNIVDGGRIYYWRNSSGDEVDAVVRIGRNMLPVESKHRTRIQKSDLRGIRRFADKFETRVGLVVTDSSMGMADDGIVAVPLWLYLLMC